MSFFCNFYGIFTTPQPYLSHSPINFRLSKPFLWFSRHNSIIFKSQKLTNKSFTHKFSSFQAFFMVFILILLHTSLSFDCLWRFLQPVFYFKACSQKVLYSQFRQRNILLLKDFIQDSYHHPSSFTYTVETSWLYYYSNHKRIELSSYFDISSRISEYFCLLDIICE